MLIRLFVAAALVVCGIFAQAQPAQAKAQLTLAVKSAQAGAVVRGAVKLTIPPGYHAYQNPPSKDYMIPVKVSIVNKDCVLKGVVYPQGKDVKATGETEPIRVYENTIEIPFEFVAPKKAGQTTVKVSVNYQLCVDAECYPPEDAVATAKLNVVAVKK